jgi:hypothetical protein
MLRAASTYNGVTTSLWNESVNRASAFVKQQRDGLLSYSVDSGWDPEYAAQQSPNGTVKYVRTRNCYQIWKFGNSVFTQLYGDANGDFKCTDGDTEAQRNLDYGDVLTAIESIRSVPPADEYVMTPLAQGLCDTLTKLYNAGGSNVVLRSMLLESDGLENWSDAASACAGPYSSTTFDSTLRNTSNSEYYAWAGGTTPYSWQWRVYTAAVLNGFFNGTLTTTRADLDAVVVPDSMWAPGVLGLKENWSWIDFYMAATGLDSSIPGAEEQMKEMARKVTMHIDALYTFIPPQSSASAYAVGDPSDELKAFTRGLSEDSGGRFQKIQYRGDMSARPGLAHPYPGDVSDDSCVSIADYKMVIQPDAYNRPSSDSQFTARVDANRDGWVNLADASLVLKNKGCGYCQGTSGPFVTCKVPTLN